MQTSYIRITPKVVKLLLGERGILVNQANNNLETPLNAAAYYGNPLVVELLLKQSDIDVNKEDKWGSTPLDSAYEHGSSEDGKKVIELLRDAGAYRSK